MTFPGRHWLLQEVLAKGSSVENPPGGFPHGEACRKPEAQARNQLRGWPLYRCRRCSQPPRPALQWSGKEALSPAPPPLRTVRETYTSYGSSTGQRPCEIRSSAAPPADDTPCGTRLPHWPWGQPGRYCARAGSRDDLRWWQQHQQRTIAVPPTFLHRCLTPVD